MGIEMKEKVFMILQVFVGYMKSENLGLEIFKDGSLVFVDQDTNERWKITAENLQRLYDEYEVEK